MLRIAGFYCGPRKRGGAPSRRGCRPHRWHRQTLLGMVGAGTGLPSPSQSAQSPWGGDRASPRRRGENSLRRRTSRSQSGTPR